LFPEKNGIIITSISHCYEKLLALKQVRFFLAHRVHYIFKNRAKQD